jgi:hypothetical protein
MRKKKKERREFDSYQFNILEKKEKMFLENLKLSRRVYIVQTSDGFPSRKLISPKFLYYSIDSSHMTTKTVQAKLNT